MSRRFPAPWSVRELEQAFVMSDANGQAVAYTYFRKDENEARQARLAMRSELIGLVLALIGLVSMMVVLVVAYRAR